MPIQNADIADMFNRMADLLDIQGQNPFRIRAYRNAARTLSSLPREVAEMIADKEDLTRLSGIGEDLAGKIREIVETGRLKQLEKLEKDNPGKLRKLLNIDMLGPKRIKVLHDELGITDLDSLKQAAEKGKIRAVEGFGKKTEQTILESLAANKGQSSQRLKRHDAIQRAVSLMAYLKKTKGLKEIVIAGSFRRKKETVGDLDILATCKRGADIMSRFTQYEDVQKIIANGKTKSSVRLRSGLHVDFRVVPQVGFGAALHYFTGSKAHNIAVRKLAAKKGLKINEYGVFKGDDRVAGKTEKEVFDAVGLPCIEPELREDQGEIQAASEGKLPNLVTVDDIKGDLHTHTRVTDGHHSLAEMAKAARDLGYAYLANTEHTRRVTVAGGLDEAAMRRQIREVDKLNEKLDGIVLLKSAEVDILKNGDLDLPEDVLRELDFTVCSVHYHRNLPKEKQTERIVRAMDNPYFTILGHPSGRLINERPSYDVDMESIIEAAGDRNCFLELNAHPDRLDLTDQHCRMARKRGVKIAISTDAHSTMNLDFMKYGVDQARRGWLEKVDVLNTRPLKDLKKIFKRK